jgi:hypothetical protein
VTTLTVKALRDAAVPHPPSVTTSPVTAHRDNVVRHCSVTTLTVKALRDAAVPSPALRDNVVRHCSVRRRPSPPSVTMLAVTLRMAFLVTLRAKARHSLVGFAQGHGEAARHGIVLRL